MDFKTDFKTDVKINSECLLQITGRSDFTHLLQTKYNYKILQKKKIKNKNVITTFITVQDFPKIKIIKTMNKQKISTEIYLDDICKIIINSIASMYAKNTKVHIDNKLRFEKDYRYDLDYGCNVVHYMSYGFNEKYTGLHKTYLILENTVKLWDITTLNDNASDGFCMTRDIGPGRLSYDYITGVYRIGKRIGDWTCYGYDGKIYRIDKFDDNGNFISTIYPDEIIDETVDKIVNEIIEEIVDEIVDNE
jgi:hypothetical protein